MKDKKQARDFPDVEPRYRKPSYQDLSDLVAGRVQAGPQSTPPRAGVELDDWQDPELFHSPEL